MRAAQAIGLSWVLLIGSLAPVSAGERWGWLGVGIQAVSEEVSWELVARFGPLEGNGVQVVEVLPDSPARAAGFHTADIIVQVAGSRVWDVKGLQGLIRSLPIGTEVEVIVLRGRRRVAVSPRIAPMPEDVHRGLAGERYGLVVRPSVAANGQDVLTVMAVEAGSAAEAAGIRPGDIVVEVQDREVWVLRDYADIFSRIEGRDPLRVVVHRGEERVSVMLGPAVAGPGRRSTP